MCLVVKRARESTFSSFCHQGLIKQSASSARLLIEIIKFSNRANGDFYPALCADEKSTRRREELITAREPRRCGGCLPGFYSCALLKIARQRVKFHKGKDIMK
jgi:hypothetical protein